MYRKSQRKATNRAKQTEQARAGSSRAERPDPSMEKKRRKKSEELGLDYPIPTPKRCGSVGGLFPIDHPARPRPARPNRRRATGVSSPALHCKGTRASERLRQRRRRTTGIRRRTLARGGGQRRTPSRYWVGDAEGNGEKRGSAGPPFLSCVASALFHVDERGCDRHLADNI